MNSTLQKPGFWITLIVFLLLAAGAWQLLEWRNQPPEVGFAETRRETITSAVSTNGRVEPSEWGSARAETSGSVTEVLVALNQRVSRGQELVQIEDTQARADLESARARIAQIQTELDVLNAGGPASERTTMESDIARLKLDLEAAQRDRDREVNLEAKNASTRVAVRAAEDRVDQLEQQIAALEKRRAALVSPDQVRSAEARLREANAAAEATVARLVKSVVRAPLSGTIYEFDLKPGAFLNPGEEIARIGQLDPVVVNVFVDEPDLGRVAKGKTVTITWDALPGREWTGVVDRLPSQIVSLESRQVGEVLCRIDNPDGTLIPGTNVNVVIESEVAEGAITLPKEALFREGGQLGVYVIVDGAEGNPDAAHLEWRPITQGVNNVTRTQVTGLQEGERVALPGAVELSDGMVVQKPAS